MVKLALTAVFLAVLALLGRWVYESYFVAPELVVAWNFPPPRTVGGRYTYVVGFTPGSGSPFSAFAVTHVDIVNQTQVNIDSIACSDAHWSLSMAPRTKIVVADGQPIPSVAIRFRDVAPDVSFTLREMHVSFRFDYRGWLGFHAGRTASVTLLVPTPFTSITTEAQRMDTVHYRSYYQDLGAGVAQWHLMEH